MSAVGLGDKNGVLVTLIRKNSRAQQIDLKENDVIRAVNNQPVNGLSDLAKVYEKQPKAKPITLSVWRNQTEHSLQIPAK